MRIRNPLLFLIISVLALSSLSLAQNNDDVSQTVTPQVYAGANLNLVFLGGHIGAKDVFIDNLGVRFDVITTLPLSFQPGVVLGASGFYTFHEENNVAFYAGGGLKTAIGANGIGTVGLGGFGISGIAGAEFIFEPFSTFVEVDFTVATNINDFITIPILRLGVSVPF